MFFSECEWTEWTSSNQLLQATDLSQLTPSTTLPPCGHLRHFRGESPFQQVWCWAFAVLKSLHTLLMWWLLWVLLLPTLFSFVCNNCHITVFHAVSDYATGGECQTPCLLTKICQTHRGAAVILCFFVAKFKKNKTEWLMTKIN